MACPDTVLLRESVVVDAFLDTLPATVPDSLPADIHIQTPNGYAFRFTGLTNVSSLFGNDMGAFVRAALAGMQTNPDSVTLPIPLNSAAQVRAAPGTHIKMGQVFRYQDELLLGLVFFIAIYLLVLARLKIRPGIVSTITIPLLLLIVLILLYVFGFNREIDLSQGAYFSVKGSAAIRLMCRSQTSFDAQGSGIELSPDFGVNVTLETTDTSLSAITSLADSLIQDGISQFGNNLVRSIIVPAINRLLLPS
jgi:hypothetical protein